MNTQLVAGHRTDCPCSTCVVLRSFSPPAVEVSSGWDWRHWTGLFTGIAVVGFVGGMALARGWAAILIPLWLIAVVGAFYFLPTMIAHSRKHQNVAAIAVVNFFLGWTFIGWVAALAWASTTVRRD